MASSPLDLMIVQQAPSPDNDTNGIVYAVVDEIPSFPGGVQAMKKFISAHLKDPQDPKGYYISGNCILKFVVRPNGKITTIQLLKKLEGCPTCDAAAIRVIEDMPLWIPGKHSGRNVAAFYNVVIPFRPK